MINETLEADRAYRKDMADAYDRGYAKGKADAESHWIPVKYNPKKDGIYLITLKREDEIFVDALNYNSEMGWGFYPDWGDGFISMPDVIAWMPVPEPYKEVEE